MVYDGSVELADRTSDKKGYAIVSPINEKSEDVQDTYWTIFTDDGKGNGDFVCHCPDKYWAERIAYALDEVKELH